tara:strand:- start:1731 stop:2231 length:501 start_codon:yes stop_codon:yes gene_type:complete
MKNASQQYKELYEQMCQLCASEGWGDPFSYARGKEIYMANAFNHQIWKAYSGPDGVDEAGECEYKSTIQSRIQGTYNGISVQATWDEQLAYLRDEKIAKYMHHYFGRFNKDSGTLEEAYVLTGDQVLDILIPKLEKQYAKKASAKDPRLGASVSSTEIKKHGKKII